MGTLGFTMVSPLVFSCRKDTLIEDVDFDGKVLIIGSGAAGLYAGFTLQQHGIDFQILEAADRIGGRLGKNESFADFPIDLGAQWIHGRNSILADLAVKTNTALSEDDSDAFYWQNETIKDGFPQELIDLYDQDGMPDISYADFAQQEGFGDDFKYLVETLAGDQGADSSRLSAAANYKEEEDWNSGETDYKLEKTIYDLLHDHVAVPIMDHIQLSTVVSKIDYQSDLVEVTDSNGNTYSANKIIVTVPITVLKDGDIEFVPALPAEQTASFQKIGMDAGMKVFLKFNQRFYKENLAGGLVCAAYADEITGKTGTDHVLLAFIMGKQAEDLTALGSDQAIVDALLAELDGIYDGQASASFQDALVQNWTTEPFVRGAYSYSTVGIGNARSTATKAVDDKVFFAGEAMNINGHHQTVHGAMETGYREVLNILNVLDQ